MRTKQELKSRNCLEKGGLKGEEKKKNRQKNLMADSVSCSWSAGDRFFYWCVGCELKAFEDCLGQRIYPLSHFFVFFVFPA